MSERPSSRQSAMAVKLSSAICLICARELSLSLNCVGIEARNCANCSRSATVFASLCVNTVKTLVLWSEPP
ncbi:hypothetical protein D3C87_1998900 [compost metagenome]